MSIKSAGILLYRVPNDKNNPEVFLVRANISNRNVEMWGVPKGRTELGEQLFDTATREFREETGVQAPENLDYSLLPPYRVNSGKIINIFTADSGAEHIEWQRNKVAVNTVTRGRTIQFHRETLDGKWFTLSQAYEKIGAGQKGLLELFENHFNSLANV